MVAEFEDKFKKIVTTVAQLSQGVQLVYNNQVELTKSHDRLEEQFAVLGRTCFLKINELVAAHNKAVTSEHDVEPLTEEFVTQTFNTWREFRERPDFREHFVVWFMGGDLSTLPPPPEPEDDSAKDPQFQDAVEFGGDYAESEDGDETTEDGAEASDPETPVSGVQASDEAETESRETIN